MVEAGVVVGRSLADVVVARWVEGGRCGRGRWRRSWRGARGWSWSFRLTEGLWSDWLAMLDLRRR